MHITGETYPHLVCCSEPVLFLEAVWQLGLRDACGICMTLCQATKWTYLVKADLTWVGTPFMGSSPQEDLVFHLVTSST